MSFQHSALIAGGPSKTAAFYADSAGTHGLDAVSTSLGRTQSRVTAQNAPPTGQTKQVLENDIRMEERCRERARIVHELHDTLLQGFLGASMLLGQAVEQMPADSPSKPALSRVLILVRRAIDEGRRAIRGLPSASAAPASLEQAFSTLLAEVASGRGTEIRIFVQGRTRELNPAILEQLFLIGREAVMNALRHSEATNIEVEIQYLRDFLRMLVRDNGCGIKPEAVQKESDSHWGLRGMRQRSEKIGAQFEVWSQIGAGTEVLVSVAADGATMATIDVGLREGRHD